MLTLTLPLWRLFSRRNAPFFWRVTRSSRQRLGPAKTVAWAGDGKSLAKLRADGKELCVTGAVLEAFSGAKQGGAKGERVRAKRGSGGQHRAQPENLPASALPSLPR